MYVTRSVPWSMAPSAPWAGPVTFSSVIASPSGSVQASWTSSGPFAGVIVVTGAQAAARVIVMLAVAAAESPSASLAL